MKIKYYSLVICILSIYFTSVHHVTSKMTISRQYNRNANFTKLIAVDNEPYLYVAGKNVILQLNKSDLSIKSEVKTGPKNFSLLCVFESSGCKCEQPKYPPGYNKTNCYPRDTDATVITWYAYNETLYICYNLYHGFCEKRSLKDVQRIVSTTRAVGIVGSNPNSETFMLVKDDFIYLGTQYAGYTYVTNFDYVPFTMRDENFMYIVVKNSIPPQGRLAIIEDLNKIPYNIKFKHIFYYKPPSSQFGYVYYVIVRPNQDQNGSKMVTKMVRICEKNYDFHSYIELPLECHEETVDSYKKKYDLLRSVSVNKVGSKLAKALDIDKDDDVMIATFGREKVKTSALCIYPLKDVDKKFQTAITQCDQGYGTIGPSYFNGMKNGLCQPIIIPRNESNFCNYENYENRFVNWPIMQQTPINSTAIYMTNISVNSLSVTPVSNNSTVALLAHENGLLSKLNILVDHYGKPPKLRAVKLDSLRVDSSPIINLKLNNMGLEAFVSTSDKIASIEIAACSYYTTCESCTAARDPYCGWCLTKGMCTHHLECQENNHWLNNIETTADKCPSIASIQPPGISHSTAKSLKSQNLVISLRNVDDVFLVSRITCAFYTQKMILIEETQAFKIGNLTISCDSPMMSQVPALPSNAESLKIPLSIQINSHKLVTGRIHIYNCTYFPDCEVCTKSGFPCRWSLIDNKCINENDQARPVDIVTLESSCPRFFKIDQRVIRGPAGNDINFDVRVENVKESTLFCVENCTNKLVTGKYSPSKISCTFHQLSPKMFKKQYCALSIFSGNSMRPKYLLNKDDVGVEVYNCSQMASYCDNCKQLDPLYNCAWCAIRKQCLYNNAQTDCQSTLLRRDSPCSDPIVSRIFPENTTVNAESLITIQGHNLGQHNKSVNVKLLSEENLTLGYCKVDRYVSSKQFQCRLYIHELPIRPLPHRGRLVISLNNSPGSTGFTISLMEPKIISVSPTSGPQDGGTLLTISGEYLNVGLTQKVLLNSTKSLNALPCTIIRASTDRIQCLTASFQSIDRPQRFRRSLSEQAATYHIVLQIDNQIFLYPSVDFSYVDNPQIHKVSRSNFIRGGGLSIELTGINFESIQNPRMQIFYMDQRFTSDCLHFPNLNTKLVCPSPAINLSVNIPPDKEIPMKYSFEMDGVAAVATLTDCVIFPNPIVKTFSNGEKKTIIQALSGSSDQSAGVQAQKGRPPVEFTISAQYLNNKVINKKDINVTLGGISVTAKSFTEEILVCEIANVNAFEHNVYYPLQVSIGYLSYEVGDMKFVRPGGPLPTSAIIIITAMIFLVIVIIICFVICVIKVKAQSSKKRERGLQGQMQELERTVANKCKAAFAEYVTEFTNFVQDVGFGHSNIPFRNYQEFCFLFLFPDHKGAMDQHPVLSTFKVSLQAKHDVERGLQHLSELIMDRTFLMTMIEVMEQNEEFDVHHKVKVASFLSVVLQHKMDYFTEILKCLIEDIIKRYKQENKNPKLFMRRSESVAEKLVPYWFAFLLHSTLEARFGEPLFMLYRAIVQRLNMGPVDFYTGDSYYALCTEKLIRNDRLEYTKIKLEILDPNKEFNMEECRTVSVFDVDCITQVKEKILDALYKGQPDSQRLHPDDFDLVLVNEYETNNQESSSLMNPSEKILQDFDNFTERPKDGFYRINTLGLYKVPDQASVYLRRKEDPNIFGTANFKRSTRTLQYDDTDTRPMKNSTFLRKYDSTYPNNIGSTPFSSTSRIINPSVISTPVLSGTAADYSQSQSYHIVKNDDPLLTGTQLSKKKQHQSDKKIVHEAFLNYLLTTKTFLNDPIDEFMEAIFSTTYRGSALPKCIKYMFDFFDRQAIKYGFVEPDIVHTWKSNALPLRFWVQLVKNPYIIFDIPRNQPAVEGCLNVISSALMDSCSFTDSSITKDSPASKLIFYKDMKKYRQRVARYYQEIHRRPAILEDEMVSLLQEHSRQHDNVFNISRALVELYFNYINIYCDQICHRLESDSQTRMLCLHNKLLLVRSHLQNANLRIHDDANC